MRILFASRAWVAKALAGEPVGSLVRDLTYDYPILQGAALATGCCTYCLLELDCWPFGSGRAALANLMEVTQG